MRFAVYVVVAPIQDPDDAFNVLENLRYRKATLRASQVFDRMSLCDIDTLTRSVLPDFPSLSSRTVEEVPPHAPPLLRGENWTIQPGDPIEEIQEPPPPPKKN
jgi:hypothetical protein